MEDVLSTLNTPVAILKIDVEAMECKVLRPILWSPDGKTAISNPYHCENSKAWKWEGDGHLPEKWILW